MTGKSQRRIANFLLQPLVQLKLGLLNVVLSLIFVVSLGAYAYGRFKQFADVVATLTQANDEIARMLASYLNGVGATALAASVVFVIINLAASVYITHRLVGPTIAFRRHIRRLYDGDFRVKTKLRASDAFSEVADDLNRLSDRLQESVGQGRS